jgi:hypothetical protein
MGEIYTRNCNVVQVAALVLFHGSRCGLRRYHSVCSRGETFSCGPCVCAYEGKGDVFLIYCHTHVILF